MRRVLNQDEIDALFSAAQPGQKSEPAAKKHVERCDLGKSKTLSAEQIRVVNTLHESFARRLSDSLGTYLRTGCEMSLVAAEQLRYSEFLGRVPELSYLASLRRQPLSQAHALMLPNERILTLNFEIRLLDTPYLLAVCVIFSCAVKRT